MSLQFRVYSSQLKALSTDFGRGTARRARIHERLSYLGTRPASQHYLVAEIQSESSLWTAKPRLPCLKHGLHPIGNLELTEYIRDVIADCFWTDVKLLGDLLIIEAASDEVQHLALPVCQIGKGGILRKAQAGGIQILEESGKAFSDGGPEESFPFMS